MQRGIAIYDLHYPLHHEKLLNNTLRYIKSNKWDWLVLGGDTLDMGAISHHAFDHGNHRELEGKRLKQDYKGMTQLLLILCKYFKHIVWLQGNHEDWAEKLVDKYPGLEGLLEVENNLPFDALGIESIKPRHFKKIGKLLFIHGDIFNKYSPTFHSKRVVEIYNRNVIYGHGHNHQVYIKCSPVDLHDKHIAVSMPCMADLTKFKYPKDKPSNWCNGFGVFYVNDNRFSNFTIISVDGTFISPEGRTYE